MSRLEMLRELVEERLTTAAYEIFVVFEKTIKVYEEEISRQRELLGVLKPGELCITDVQPRQLFVCEENGPREQQERSSSLGHEDPEPQQVKDQQEDRLTGQKGAQLQEMEEADIVKFTFTAVPVKNEHNDREKRQSLRSQLSNEEIGETSPLPSTSTEQMKTEPELWDCGTVEHNVMIDPPNYAEPINGGQLHSECSETIESGDDCMDIRELESGLETLSSKRTQKSIGQSLSISNELKRSVELSHEINSPHPFCQVCGKSFSINFSRHLKIHPKDCGVCGKHLEPLESLELHLKVHLTCYVCGKRFNKFSHQERHVRIHTGERPFSCTVCGKKFVRKDNMKSHMRRHTGQKLSSCRVCGLFFWTYQLQSHMRCHKREKTSSCTD